MAESGESQRGGLGEVGDAGEPSIERGRLPERLVAAAIRRPVLTLLVCGAATLIAAVGATGLQVETSTDSVLNRSGPDWAFYQHSQDLFGGDELLAVAVEAERPFDAAALAKVDALSDALDGVIGVRRVDSISTVPVVRGTPAGDLELRPALRRASDRPSLVEERLRGDRIAPRSLVSEDGRTFAVNVFLEKDTDDRYEEIFESIHEILAESGARVWHSGVPVFRYEATRSTRQELLFFVPITIASMGLLLFVIFGSWVAVLVPLAASGAGTIALVGVMAVLGVPLTITTAILPSVILALGCAYVMHLLCAAAGVEGRLELEHALRPIALPIALSGLTTAIGFVAISLVRIEAIRDVGAFGALGVLAVLVLSLSAAPAILSLRPLPATRRGWTAWLGGTLGPRLNAFTAQHSRSVLALWAVALLLLATGLSRVNVETDATRWFPPGNPIRDSYETIRERLSGISPVNVVIQADPNFQSALESESELRVTSREALTAIDGLSAYLTSLPTVGKALSVADPLRQLHGGFVDDPDLPLPEDPNLVEQYLLLLDSVEQLDDLVTTDRSAANVALRVNDNGSAHLLEVARAAERWWEANGPPGFSARATGIMYEFARAEDEISHGQIRGLVFAVGTIGVILFAIFRRGLLSVVALIPNAVPVVMMFGFMGLAGIPLDAGTVLVGSFALGIAVDDTIHVLTAYHAQRLAGADARASLDSAMERVLPPLVYTTVVVAVGFAVLGFSGFTFTRNLGILTAVVMGLCLLADASLLPALLLRVKGYKLMAPARPPSVSGQG